jgi:hypothetical protein
MNKKMTMGFGFSLIVALSKNRFSTCKTDGIAIIKKEEK